MKPYQPSNKITSAGMTWLALSAIVGGVAIGTLTHFIALFVYLIILFPLGMGVAGGTVTAIATRRGKVRNPAISGLFGVLTGIILYSTMHLADYWQFQRSATEEITKELGQTTPSDQVLDQFLQQETGATGFWGYLKYSAKQGVSIGRVGRKGANLGETGTWIYWALEFGVITAMTGAIAYFAAREPFCETCNQWYGDKTRMGSIDARSSEQFLSLLNRSEFSHAGALINPLHGIEPPRWEAQQQQCATCQASNVLLTVDKTGLDHKGNLERREAIQGMLLPGEYQQLHSGMTTSFTEGRATPITDEELRLAQQERLTISASDSFEPHELSPTQVSDLVQQLAQYPVETAYLVRKRVQYLPEKPFYVLGIVRRKNLIEAKEAEVKLLGKLAAELKVPEQTTFMGLNNDKAMTESLKQVTSSTIYQR